MHTFSDYFDVFELTLDPVSFATTHFQFLLLKTKNINK